LARKRNVGQAQARRRWAYRMRPAVLSREITRRRCLIGAPLICTVPFDGAPSICAGGVTARTVMDNYQNPQPGKTYISPGLPDFNDPSRKVRIATKLIVHPATYAYAQEKKEVVLRQKEEAKSCIRAKFFEDDRGMLVLSIQKYTVATMKPHNVSFSFIGEEIGKLIEFLGDVKTMPLTGGGSFKITDEQLKRLVLSSSQAQSLLPRNQEVIAEVVRHSLTKEDVVAVAYRKSQLQVFDRLLSDPAYFEEMKARKKCGSNEALWQKFFEKNPWIFGYGLSYIYLSGLDDKKLEQVVSGHMVFKHGKRADALLRSRGLISSLCFLEIKTHLTDLLAANSYRGGCWAPSSELAGAVAQVQGTVAMAAAEIRKLSGTTDEGDPTGEEAYNHMPRSFLVVGNLKEFVTVKGVNEEKHRSFELFRGNTASPEIITFDELYERARFIVHQHETAPVPSEG
jgi:hypothetical protein